MVVDEVLKSAVNLVVEVLLRCFVGDGMCLWDVSAAYDACACVLSLYCSMEIVQKVLSCSRYKNTKCFTVTLPATHSALTAAGLLETFVNWLVFSPRASLIGTTTNGMATATPPMILK